MFATQRRQRRTPFVAPAAIVFIMLLASNAIMPAALFAQGVSKYEA